MYPFECMFSWFRLNFICVIGTIPIYLLAVVLRTLTVIAICQIQLVIKNDVFGKWRCVDWHHVEISAIIILPISLTGLTLKDMCVKVVPLGF